MSYDTTGFPDNVREETLAADYLIKNVVDKASGVTDQECHNNPPRDVYFIGNLRPSSDVTDSLSRAHLMQKLAPSAFGAEFKLVYNLETVEIKVTLSWDLYYRVFPTYAQQHKWLNRVQSDPVEEEQDESNNDNSDAEENDSVPPPIPPRRRSRTSNEQLYVRYKKIPCEATGIIELNRLDGKLEGDTDSLELAITEQIDAAVAQIRQDPERIRLRTAGQLFTLPADALQSEQSFNHFISQLTVEIDHPWEWKIETDVYEFDATTQYEVVLIQFVNETDVPVKSKIMEPFFFNTRAKFYFSPKIVSPFELELAAASFRYDRLMWGKGFNCGVEGQDDTFTTTHVPIFSQPRYLTNDIPAARFADLASNPIPVLQGIIESMRAYSSQWEEQHARFIEHFGEQEWNANYRSKFLHDQQTYQQEIDRFEQGFSLIKSDDDIRLAFMLANESFRRTGIDAQDRIRKEKWRLFQIVFLVSQIPGMAALKPEYKERFEVDREFVDIIYFPTGGGKTEAYLGVLVFHCFFDRLRNKTAGVTCWIRFPLRLLTLQQTQRLADIIGTADIVRREQTDPRLSGKVAPFGIGYYAGTEASPNKIQVSGSNNADLSTARDPKERQRWKRVVNCPSCKTPTIEVDFDENTVRLSHRCTNETCGFENGRLPLYIVDMEIYRYVPTVLVGTIDKLAIIGFQYRFSTLLGKVDKRCPVHGFAYDSCNEYGCKAALVDFIPEGISGPTLFLQDELHLLNEGFGTFDSHYETFMQYLLKRFNPDHTSLKIIASTATIEKYERQVQHLYGKRLDHARVFPGPGPTLKESFYATTEKYPQRIFVGILPHNKTILNSILELIEYYHKAVHQLLTSTVNPYGGKYTPGSVEWNQLMNLYYSSLTYFLANRELNSIKSDVESHVNPELTREGIKALDVKELNSNTTTSDVAAILQQLETFHQPADTKEAVLATNMVSHGVDIDRLNFMLFHGMPRKTAEYIQASSRVGRSHVGIVFNCMHPIMERDQSHYAYFSKYHEFLGQLVEPVAINRWSALALRRTLPGLFTATVFQIIADRETRHKKSSYTFTDNISKKLQNGEIDPNEIKNILKEAFNASISEDDRNRITETKIENAVDLFVRQITNAGNDAKRLTDAIFPKVLMSLRDIDEAIEIRIDQAGQQWLNNNNSHA